MVSSARPARARPSSDSYRVLSYNRVRELAAQPHVAHLPDRVLDAYEAEVTDGYRHSAHSNHGAFSIITEGRQGPWAPAGPLCT